MKHDCDFNLNYKSPKKTPDRTTPPPSCRPNGNILVYNAIFNTKPGQGIISFTLQKANKYSDLNQGSRLTVAN